MMFLSPEEWEVVVLTLRVPMWSVAFGVPVAVLAAWQLVRGRFPGRAVLDALMHLPIVLPPVVVCWLPLVFGVRGAVGAWLLSWFGIRLVFTTAGASLACAVMSLPLMLRPLRLSLEAVDRRLEPAARTLAAGPIDRFLTIILPHHIAAGRTRRAGRRHRRLRLLTGQFRRGGTICWQ
jgi:molybdate transport system permease protein